MRALLVVDDDEDLRDLVTLVLDLSGRYESVAVGTVEEAIVELSSVRFDGVLLDLSLHDGSANTVLEQLTSRLGGTAVILFTAAIDIDPTLESSVAGVIRKPFDPLTLADQIDALLTDQPVAERSPG